MTRYLLIAALVMTSFAAFTPTTSALCYGGRDTETGEACTSSPTTPAGSSNGSGIYSCTAPGATSVASTAAIGGTYVPVFDAAVALNTGVLAYKECVLKGLFNQTKQAATLSMTDRTYKFMSGQASNGRNGNPYWVVNYSNELGQVSDRAFVKAFQSGVLSSLNSAFQSQIKNALVRNYQMTTRAPQNGLTCPYGGDWRAVTRNPTQNFSSDALFAMANPNCDVIYSYTTARDQMSASVAASQDEWNSRLARNNGIYDVVDQNGNVVVPGSFLNAIGSQSLTSGFRQLENADDIGEMVGPLFAGIGTSLFTGPSSIARVQAYIDRAVEQQRDSLASAAVNTALTNLYQILNWEQQYNDILSAIADILTDAINQLRGTEQACFALVIQNVCAASSTPSGNSCTSTTDVTLSIATSTAFSDAAIAKRHIAEDAEKLKQAASTSLSNLNTINTLIIEVQSGDSSVRNSAISKLNAIINAQPPVITNQNTVAQAQQELEEAHASYFGDDAGNDGFVTKTIQKWEGDALNTGGTLIKHAVAWDGTIDPGTGWCNVAKEDTLNQWIQKWTQ